MQVTNRRICDTDCGQQTSHDQNALIDLGVLEANRFDFDNKGMTSAPRLREPPVDSKKGLPVSEPPQPKPLPPQRVPRG